MGRQKRFNFPKLPAERAVVDAKGRRCFAGVPGSAMEFGEKRLNLTIKDPVALRTAEPKGPPEIGLRESAARAGLDAMDVFSHGNRGSNATRNRLPVDGSDPSVL